MYQCTYPGCHEQRLSVDAIESHVRVGHLNRPEELDLSIDDSERDHEEEFYYTETEYEEVIDVEPPQLQVNSHVPSHKCIKFVGFQLRYPKQGLIQEVP